MKHNTNHGYKSLNTGFLKIIFLIIFHNLQTLIKIVINQFNIYFNNMCVCICNIYSKALDLYIAIAILRVQEGHDVTNVIEDESDTSEFRGAGRLHFSIPPVNQYALQKGRFSSESHHGNEYA